MVWGPMIAVYLFVAGAAAGSYLTASLVSFKYPGGVFTRKAGRIIAPILLAIGLLMLMLDAEAGLRNPLRFLGLFANPRSVMTIGTYIISVFMVVALIVAVLELMGKNVPRALDIVGDIGAICLAGYTGFLLGDSLGVPLWHNSVLPPLFIVSALTSGMAIVSLIGAAFDYVEFEKMGVLRPIHIVLAVLEILLIVALLVIASGRGAAGAESVAMLTTGSLAPAFWIGVVGIGLVLPLAIDLFNMRSTKSEASGEALAQTGVVVGGFLLRFVVVSAGVMMVLL